MTSQSTIPRGHTAADEATIRRYFEAFNNNAFIAAAALFSPQGKLSPPFEKAIVGRAAIARYLEQKAEEMTAYPQEPYADSSEDGQLHVVGQVDAIAFKVGVEWIFSLTASSEIQSLSVRLRASMEELLTIRPD
ncbi:MAG: nuclear transport factor 2 family protein [Cyanobacteria bacterium P01_D01_bin.56]